MKRLTSVGLILATTICLLYLFLSPRSKYEWMVDIDPEVSVAAIEDPSGNRVVAGVLAVLGVWLCQALLAWGLKGSRKVLFPLIVSILAGVLWYARFN